MAEHKSVEGRGADLLVHFARRTPPTFEAREAAELLAVDASTAARVLSTLVARGWVVRHRRSVIEDNTSARTFYERQGWAWDGTRLERPLGGFPGFPSVVEVRYALDLS